MNPDRHMESHVQYYQHLVEGDGDSADAHRRFYDEYNAVMDLPAEYYLETVERVFQKHLLPQGKLVVAGERVRPEAIKDAALFTIEGELDDISGNGQTEAAQALCKGIPERDKQHFLRQGRRPLRHLQRAQVPRDDLSADPRLHRQARSEVEASMTKPVTPQEMFDLWQKMVNPGAYPLQSLMFPVLDPKEIEKKIGELEVVEHWLKANVNMVQLTIKSLQYQRAMVKGGEKALRPWASRGDRGEVPNPGDVGVEHDGRGGQGHAAAAKARKAKKGACPITSRKA